MSKKLRSTIERPFRVVLCCVSLFAQCTKTKRTKNRRFEPDWVICKVGLGRTEDVGTYFMPSCTASQVGDKRGKVRVLTNKSRCSIYIYI